MTVELKYPSMEAAASIFQKLGIDPSTRFDALDQDFEYTSCRVSELEQYFTIYQAHDTTEQEKRVLGCFLFECLNEYILSNDKEHPIFSEVMMLLHCDESIHRTEIEYWVNTQDADEQYWWPITSYVLRWQHSQ